MGIDVVGISKDGECFNLTGLYGVSVVDNLKPD